MIEIDVSSQPIESLILVHNQADCTEVEDSSLHAHATQSPQQRSNNAKHNSKEEGEEDEKAQKVNKKQIFGQRRRRKQNNRIEDRI